MVGLGEYWIVWMSLEEAYTIVLLHYYEERKAMERKRSGIFKGMACLSAYYGNELLSAISRMNVNYAQTVEHHVTSKTRHFDTLMSES